MSTIEIPVRELHARTGHYVRKAASHQRIVITDRGKRVAQLQPLEATGKGGQPGRWRERTLLPEFKAIMDEPVGGTESGAAVAVDRNRGEEW